MKKRTAGQILAENIRRLMEDSPDLNSSGKVGAKGGASQKTINNLSQNRHSPKLSSIEAAAKSFHLEPYQLLMPLTDQGSVTLLRAYNVADDRDKKWLMLVAEETIRKAGGRDAGEDAGISD